TRTGTPSTRFTISPRPATQKTPNTCLLRRSTYYRLAWSGDSAAFRSRNAAELRANRKPRRARPLEERDETVIVRLRSPSIFTCTPSPCSIPPLAPARYI
ncbi:unnamed protein product, partial [Ectocarpus fasciculatus]